jgi:hypothetical protein
MGFLCQHRLRCNGHVTMTVIARFLSRDDASLTRILLTFLLIILVSAMPIDSLADSADGSGPPRRTLEKISSDPPYMQVCTHTYNQLYLSISNFGQIGAGRGAWFDCETGEPAPSAEYPPNSDLEHLYAAALWIGAVVGQDTLVSVAFDGWGRSNREMLPCSEAAICSMERRSNRPGDPFYHEDARADLELHAEYSDTIIDVLENGTDWLDRRGHIPLGISIRQTSYCWSVDYARDFILIDYAIENVFDKPLQDFYIGLYVDADVEHASNELEGHKDDICGFLESIPSRCGTDYQDTINLAWIADNNGDPDRAAEEFNRDTSTTSATGVQVLRVPRTQATVSFNWWHSNTNGSLDWGPMRWSSRRIFGTGGFGTPEGDRNKYYILSNGEHDYDQVYAAVDFSSQGWIPPGSIAMLTARGQDTRFVLSSGPYNVQPGEVLNFTISYVAGENFHVDPLNFERNLVQTYDPDSYYEGLNFNDIGENAVWATWVYDNPGIDTDNDGNKGRAYEITDTVDGEIVLDSCFYAGDGVPDFNASAPPPPPILRFTSSHEKVTLRWNGLNSETFEDPFLQIVDFEGYVVYMGRDPTSRQMSRIASHDFVDFSPQVWDAERSVYVSIDNPVRIDELVKMYGEEFDPTVYACKSGTDRLPYKGMEVCLKPADWNRSIPSWDDPKWIEGSPRFRKRFASEILAGIVTPEVDSANTDLWTMGVDPRTGDSILYHKFYEYEFVIDGLLESVPWFFSVTAFDFGDFANGVAPQESQLLGNMVEVWAINDAAYVVENGSQVQVYPNPYYADGGYVKAGYEDRRKTGFYDHERRMHFVNLPPSAVILYEY